MVLPHLRPSLVVVEEFSVIMVLNEDEVLCCEACHKPFASLEVAWLVSPLGGGRGIWAHKKCVDGKAELLLGTGEFRLKRADFALRHLITNREYANQTKIHEATLGERVRAARVAEVVMDIHNNQRQFVKLI
jgi:hypothetical protein